MIHVQNIRKKYAQTVALDEVSHTFQDGKTTVLIGPSGCGKSTLLRALVGLVTPDDGQIEIEGQGVSSGSLPALRLKMGYLIQEGGLFPHLTCRQNVTLVAEQEQRAGIAEKVSELLKLAQLDESVLDRFPSQVSGGQRQRVALMRSLMLSPDVLLLDEPLGALDPMVRADLQTDLREAFRALEKTVILVTHDLAEAAFFGDEIVLMRDGKIEQSGSFRDLVESPTSDFVRQFVQTQQSILSTEVRP
ncbi:ATP-binding cassette domain-containing protein [Planctomycetota bacterium]|nr:ATP-binding cassette domain-containing protein [Planctomycetota bacterium]